MPAPSVSVVIALYNRGPAIARTLDSVIAQTRPVSEIIVSDDGSTDSSAEWIRAHYPRVRVETFDNGGTSAARNRGARAARGEILVFIDHDDEMLPDAVETLVDLLARFPSAQAAYADHALRNLTNGEVFPNHHSVLKGFARMRSIQTIQAEPEARLYGRPMYYALLHGNILQQPWAIRREAFLALGGFDPGIRYCEDWELFMRVAANVPLAVTDRVISNHFIEGDNLHLRANQDVQHVKVLRKQLEMTAWRDPGAFVVLRRRLAMYYKAAGDRLWPTDRGGAWRTYWRSFVTWPFDAVVAARCLTWSYAAMRSARR